MKSFEEVSPEPCGSPEFNPDDGGLGRQKSWRYYHDTIHRKHLICWVMWIIPIWLVAVLAIVAFMDVSRVSDTVKTTLLVTTTANVIGLALVVLKGVFPKE